jgi:cobalt-zinc-cadmium efflux system protein
LKAAFYLNLGIIVVELVGGVMANSLALLGDAGHNATDAFAVGLAWFAQTQALRRASASMTFGHKRAGIMVALANALSLVGIALVLLWAAYQRVRRPEPVEMLPLFVTATLGFILNTYAALGLRGDPDINVRSAFLHLLGDAAASAGVIVGGVIMLLTGWHWVDPALSALIAVFIALSAWDVVRKTVRILMEGTPEGVDPAKVVSAIANMDGVQDVHDVHMWSLDAEHTAMSCHVVVEGERSVGEMRPLLVHVAQRMKNEFAIEHTTIQLECRHHGHEEVECGATSCHRMDWGE